jgi:hypothetical protein
MLVVDQIERFYPRNLPLSKEMAMPIEVSTEGKKERISEFFDVVMGIEDLDVFMQAFWLAD